MWEPFELRRVFELTRIVGWSSVRLATGGENVCDNQKFCGSEWNDACAEEIVCSMKVLKEEKFVCSCTKRD